MPYSSKLASISPDCSYLGQLVITRHIVKSFLTCTDHIHLITQNFVNILFMIACIFINCSFQCFCCAWSSHNQLEALGIVLCISHCAANKRVQKCFESFSLLEGLNGGVHLSLVG